MQLIELPISAVSTLHPLRLDSVQLRHKVTWIAGGRGKSLKLKLQLLYVLDRTFEYPTQFIFHVSFRYSYFKVKYFI